MPINIKATHVSITDSMREYAEKKLSAVEKFIKEGSKVIIDVELGRQGSHHRKGEVFYAEIDLQVDGNLFHATAEGETLEEAVDELKDEILRELQKEKTRRTEKAREEEGRAKREIRGED